MSKFRPKPRTSILNMSIFFTYIHMYYNNLSVSLQKTSMYIYREKRLFIEIFMIEAWFFFLWRFIWWMSIYSMNILYVGLCVRLQKTEMLKYGNAIMSAPLLRLTTDFFLFTFISLLSIILWILNIKDINVYTS